MYITAVLFAGMVRTQCECYSFVPGIVVWGL